MTGADEFVFEITPLYESSGLISSVCTVRVRLSVSNVYLLSILATAAVVRRYAKGNNVKSV